MPKLNAKNLPLALVPLVPMAEKWGIGDDYDREAAVSNASVVELEALIHCIDGISDDDLYGWLERCQKTPDHHTEEYAAITCLTMAIDSAKVELRKFRGK